MDPNRLLFVADLADASVLVGNPAPAPSRHGDLGQLAVLFNGVAVKRRYLAMVAPVVAEVEHVLEARARANARSIASARSASV